MSVRARIEDAAVLWRSSRFDGAVLQVLIAFAATVRKRYPRPMGDRAAFEQFIADEIVRITNGPTENVNFYFRGEHHTPLKSIIYAFIRCSLVHEGQLPADIRLTRPLPGDGVPFGGKDGRRYDGNLFNVIVLEDVLGFPIGWIWNLIRVIAEARENVDEFPDGRYPLPDGYSVNAGFIIRYPDECPDRFPPNAPPKVGAKNL